jgi:biopolymer transport protein ExbB/biopolymer transport protein TolQ
VISGGIKERRKGYESGLLFLGTLGNNSPFIGLFGTVLGIVTAFRELAGAAGNAAGMNNVMGGIAEALVATAIGILVALPAVIAYNVFTKKTQDLEENVQSIGSLILAQMKSHHDGFHTRFPQAQRPNKAHPEA